MKKTVVYFKALTLGVFGYVAASCGGNNKVDTCDGVQNIYDGMKLEFNKSKDSCVVYYLPKCMLMPGYEAAYNFYIPRDGILLSAHSVQQDITNWDYFTSEEQKNIKGAGNNGLNGFDKGTEIKTYHGQNAGCINETIDWLMQYIK